MSLLGGWSFKKITNLINSVSLDLFIIDNLRMPQIPKFSEELAKIVPF